VIPKNAVTGVRIGFIADRVMDVKENFALRKREESSTVATKLIETAFPKGTLQLTAVSEKTLLVAHGVG
jgi:hypothetical protein